MIDADDVQRRRERAERATQVYVFARGDAVARLASRDVGARHRKGDFPAAANEQAAALAWSLPACLIDNRPAHDAREHYALAC
jgi:hypothetical protein